MAAKSASAPALRQMTKRAQFLQAARGTRASKRAFALQAVQTEDEMPGIGFTVTKKTGNAPERNRIKRRLRAAVRTCKNDFHSRHNYVLIGRRAALSEPFSVLVSSLESLIARVHANRHEPKQT